MEVSIDESFYKVKILKKKIKHIYIRIDDDFNIVVSSNRMLNDSMLRKLVDENLESISKMIISKKSKIEDYQTLKYLGNLYNVIIFDGSLFIDYDNKKIYVKDVDILNKWLIKEAKRIFLERLEQNYSIFEEDIPYPRLKIRSMKTRWGVCSKKNETITLNLELIKKDVAYLDYVIIHELSHFIHFNHSTFFWELVNKYVPNYKMLRKELKE